jgi:hypothetical protein
MKNHNKKNDDNIFKAINSLSIDETKKLLNNFLSGDGQKLTVDEGLILSAFMGYYNLHKLNDGLYDDAHIISNFINYS